METHDFQGLILDLAARLVILLVTCAEIAMALLGDRNMWNPCGFRRSSDWLLSWGWSSHLFIGNPYDGYINPYFWVGFNSTYRGYNPSYPFIRPSLPSHPPVIPSEMWKEPPLQACKKEVFGEFKHRSSRSVFGKLGVNGTHFWRGSRGSRSLQLVES